MAGRTSRSWKAVIAHIGRSDPATAPSRAGRRRRGEPVEPVTGPLKKRSRRRDIPSMSEFVSPTTWAATSTE